MLIRLTQDDLCKQIPNTFDHGLRPLLWHSASSNLIVPSGSTFQQTNIKVVVLQTEMTTRPTASATLTTGATLPTNSHLDHWQWLASSSSQFLSDDFQNLIVRLLLSSVLHKIIAYCPFSLAMANAIILPTCLLLEGPLKVFSVIGLQNWAQDEKVGRIGRDISDCAAPRLLFRRVGG